MTEATQNNRIQKKHCEIDDSNHDDTIVALKETSNVSSSLDDEVSEVGQLTHFAFLRIQIYIVQSSNVCLCGTNPDYSLYPWSPASPSNTSEVDVAQESDRNNDDQEQALQDF